MATIGDKAMKESKQVNKFRVEKIKEYRKQHNIPEFSTPDDYFNWLKTPEGKEYTKELEKIRIEANETIRGRGGYRANAGRKKLYPDCVALNKRVPMDTVVKIKDYSKAKHISENEALNELVQAGYEHLNKCQA
jgi:hypothetical protein